MLTRYFVPSKTFLFGEYAVLRHGHALLLATQPGVNLVIDTAQSMPIDAFLATISQHPSSPAGRLWGRCSKLPAINSLQSPGKGFGGSSAYAMCALEYLRTLDTSMSNDRSFLFYYESIKALSDDGEGVAPSCADVAAQFYGQCTITDLQNKVASSHVWPFSCIDFAIIHTGNYYATHTHLATIEVLDDAFFRITQQGIAAFLSADAERFIHAVTQYQQSLCANGLQLPTTTHCIAKLQSAPGFITAKGCGAMGAETLCVLFDASYKQAIYAYLDSENLRLHGSSSNLVAGFART